LLTLDTRAYLFSPRRAEAERRAEQRSNRKSWVQPSQRDRRQKHPKKGACDRYTTSIYHHAVLVACDQAFRMPEHLRPRLRENGKIEGRTPWQKRLTAVERAELRAWRHEHHWHPNQLSHTTAPRCGVASAWKPLKWPSDTAKPTSFGSMPSATSGRR
jgi:hypothetical protein